MVTHRSCLQTHISYHTGTIATQVHLAQKTMYTHYDMYRIRFVRTLHTHVHTLRTLTVLSQCTHTTQYTRHTDKPVSCLHHVYVYVCVCTSLYHCVTCVTSTCHIWVYPRVCVCIVTMTVNCYNVHAICMLHTCPLSLVHTALLLVPVDYHNH